MLAGVEVLVDGIDHAESIVWDPVREVAFAGGEAGQIYEISMDGDCRVVASGGAGSSLLGLAVQPGGAIYACDAGRREILRFDVDKSQVDVVTVGSSGRRLIELSAVT